MTMMKNKHECKASRNFENCHQLRSIYFSSFHLKWWTQKKEWVCVEHLDQLTAAGPDIWIRPDQREEGQFSVIYLSCLIFSRNYAFPGCYASLATSDAALSAREKQQHKNAGTFFLAFCNLQNVAFAVRTLGYDVCFLVAKILSYFPSCYPPLHHNVTAEFRPTSCLFTGPRVKSAVGELRCPFRVDWEWDAVSGGSGCSSAHHGQLPPSSSMGILKGNGSHRSSDCVCVSLLPPGRGERERHAHS